ncbi:GSCOCT00013290001.2-RA-CDS [Cotesia congregata]|uniref:Cc_bv20.1_26.4 n=2 Tax=root TaxID=1 RepID=S6D359_COTCN|nr:hypothetical protein CcBV_26.4 [Bracoviriform congregatae]CAD6244186.1 GSCOCT00013290001.2-RA-CDS [Cotesia congregata]CAG17494.1 hypothetical protein CcBV_26.4 [Bracoviriform congregatae]CAG5094023.1 cc_bv20.1_26.4 [Cotesia congregata]CCQ71375.1 hypothetical protein BV20-1 [Cotesia congregata]
MASYSGKQPAGIKPNDPFYAMFPKNCIKKTIAIWLLRNLSIAEPIEGEKPMSILTYFMSMDEENFWSAIDHCPDCTAYIIFEAHMRRWQRKAVQSANAAAQENDLDIDMLFECNLENQPELFCSRKLLRRKCVINLFEDNKVVKN